MFAWWLVDEGHIAECGIAPGGVFFLGGDDPQPRAQNLQLTFCCPIMNVRPV